MSALLVVLNINVSAGSSFFLFIDFVVASAGLDKLMSTSEYFFFIKLMLDPFVGIIVVELESFFCVNACPLSLLSNVLSLVGLFVDEDLNSGTFFPELFFSVLEVKVFTG